MLCSMAARHLLLGGGLGRAVVARSVKPSSLAMAAAAAPTRTMVTIRGVEVTPKRVGYTALGLAGGYAVWRVFYAVTAAYLEMTIFDMGEIGFFTGVAFSAVVVGGVVALRRYGTPHPDAMTSYVLKRLRQDPLLQRKLGNQIQLGEFKSYTYKGGFSVTGYQPRRLQMILQLKGDKDNGIVSFDVARKWRQGLIFKSLCLDVATSNERILYAGGAEDVIFRGSIKML